MEVLALGLAKSGIRFLWSYKDPTEEEMLGNYGTMPLWFKDSVSERGLIVKGWVPQVSILSHRAIGAFLTHCGWNSVLESIAAGVPMLTWPMGADQFANADLLDELKVGIRVCEGDKMVPDPDEMARLVAESVGDVKRGERVRAKELSRASLSTIAKDGSSCIALNHLVNFLSKQ